jgi:hypothetical protein
MIRSIAFTAVACSLSGMSGEAFADNYVNGYVRNDGTYVQPHYQKNPNNTKLDNYSTQGNVNPYTGKAGTVDPYKPSNSYGGSNTGYGSKYRY